MALDAAGVELIRASWQPARRDPRGAGIDLFKGLFTKFPQYLKLFNQFSELDIERLQENTRLIRHAVKVIDTVTFVVDSIGDESKANALNEALCALVKGHLKRKIGLQEFRNLGIVIIDFICDLNNRRTSDGRMVDSGHQAAANSAPNNASSSSLLANKKSNANNDANNFSTSSSQDSETMTSALDKIRTNSSSSPSASSSSSMSASDAGDGFGGLSGSLGDSYSAAAAEGDSTILLARSAVHGNSAAAAAAAGVVDPDALGAGEADQAEQFAKLDTNLLVAAWTKLYSSILDLVKREEEQQQEGRTGSGSDK